MVGRDDIRICDGMANMDFAAVAAMLSKAVWSIGISEAEVRHGAENSALVVGAFLGAAQGGAQIGYARIISDKTRFAYFTDVYVEEPYRGLGIGKRMSVHILEHPELKLVYQWLLVTGTAHEFYRDLGFTSLSRPNDTLEIRNPRPKVRF